LQWFVVEQSSTYASLSTLVALIMVNVLGLIFSSSLQKHRRTEFKARLEETRIKEKLSRLAAVDELTGVFNRRKLLQLATLEFERFKSNGHQFSVLMIDIDHFKQANDTCGHDAGDEMLTKFASFVANKLRDKDIWGRWGGEEFVLVLPGLSREQGKRIAERLRLGVMEEHPLPPQQPFPFTISIGLTVVQEQDQFFGDVVKRADEAMYIAKRNGRNRTEVL
jgi:diguanylate cyclase (GGDEF)-like protein